MLKSCTGKSEPAQVKMGARDRERERKPGMCSVIQAKVECFKSYISNTKERTSSGIKISLRL